jgi:hypothetical protein
MRATCLAHINPLDLLTLVIFDEEYKLWSSSLCKGISIYCNFLPPSTPAPGPAPDVTHPYKVRTYILVDLSNMYVGVYKQAIPP